MKSSQNRCCTNPFAYGCFSLLLLLLLGCSGEGQDSGNPKAPIPVKVALPVEIEVHEWNEYPGRLDAVETVDVRSRVSGYLQKVLVQDGEKVSKGDLLFKIDPRTYEIELDRAKAELERTRTKLDLAKNELKRADRLRQSKAISDEEYDQRDQGLSETTESLHAAEAAVQMARLNLEWTEIRSPIDGRIRRELLTPGNLIKGDDTLLTTVVSVDPVYVYLEIDERSALEIRRLGNSTDHHRIRAELGLIDESDFPHRGTIDYQDPRFDVHSGTMTLRGLFENPDDILNPGLFARVRISRGPPHQAILIPSRAIANDQNQKIVWKNQPDGSLKPTPIVTGSTHGSFTVIEQGLEAGESIVVEGLAKLRPGVKVKAELMSLSYDG